MSWRADSDATMIASATRAEALARLVNREDSEAIRELAKKHTLRVYRFGGEVAGAELKTAKDAKPKNAAEGPATESLPLKAPQPEADQTRLGDALDTVLQDTAGQPVAGIILLSDGGQNMGGDPSLAGQRAGEAKAPVYTVGFGDPTPPAGDRAGSPQAATKARTAKATTQIGVGT